MTTMYYADLLTYNVYPVEVERETDAYVVNASGRREAKTSKYGTYYADRAVAVQCVRYYLEQKVVAARRTMIHYEAKLAALDAQQAVQP